VFWSHIWNTRSSCCMDTHAHNQFAEYSHHKTWHTTYIHSSEYTSLVTDSWRPSVQIGNCTGKGNIDVGWGGVVGEGMRKWDGWGGGGHVVLLFSLTDDSFEDFTRTNSVSVTGLIISCCLFVDIKYFHSVKMCTFFVKI
jgi:hypothetical protein